MVADVGKRTEIDLQHNFDVLRLETILLLTIWKYDEPSLDDTCPVAHIYVVNPL